MQLKYPILPLISLLIVLLSACGDGTVVSTPESTADTIISTTTTLATTTATADETTTSRTTAATADATTTSRTTAATADATTTSHTTTATDVPMTVVTTVAAGTKYDTPDIEVDWCPTMAEEVLVIINHSRVEAGLQPLTMDYGNMMLAAQARVKEITVKFEHKRLNGDNVFTVFDEYGVDYRTAGENLAQGYPTATEVFEGWWNSPGHKANLLNERFTHVSICVIKYQSSYYWVQLFRG